MSDQFFKLDEHGFVSRSRPGETREHAALLRGVSVFDVEAEAEAERDRRERERYVRLAAAAKARVAAGDTSTGLPSDDDIRGLEGNEDIG